MESIQVTGFQDPQLSGTLQDDPAPAAPGHPGFWDSSGGWKSPEDVGKPLVVRVPTAGPPPQLLLDARDTSGYEVLLFQEDTLTYTNLEGVPLPGPRPVLSGLSSTSAIIGGPDVALVVTGTGLSRGAMLLFNGSEEATEVVSLQTTIAMATATTPGSYPVVVRNPDGQESEPLMFEITEAAAVRRRNPVPDPEPEPRPRRSH